MNSGGRFYSSNSATRNLNCVACSAEIHNQANFCMQCGAKAPSSLVSGNNHIRPRQSIVDNENPTGNRQLLLSEAPDGGDFFESC